MVDIGLTDLPKSWGATTGDNRPGKYKRKKTKCHNIEKLSIDMRPQAMNESHMFHNWYILSTVTWIFDNYIPTLGVVHKLCLQEEVGR